MRCESYSVVRLQYSNYVHTVYTDSNYILTVLVTVAKHCVTIDLTRLLAQGGRRWPHPFTGMIATDICLFLCFEFVKNVSSKDVL